MRFCGEVQYGTGPMYLEYLIQEVSVGYIALDEGVALVAVYAGEVLQIARIS